MKNKYLLALSALFLGMNLPAALKADTGQDDNRKVVIRWDSEKQSIDGFGVGQADWADDVFVFKNRDQVMDKLFGTDGLRLNILRGEIFPHYWEDIHDKDFNTKDNIDINTLRSQLPQIETRDLLRRGQLWLTLEAQNKYHLNKLVFSVWSPPAWMKDNGHLPHDKWVSGGKLKPEHYQDFADYLVAFYEAYRSVGIQTYAISPSNEPAYAAPWNSCLWTPQEMGKFITQYLGPTFEKRKVPAKIIFGENPAWSVNFDMLRVASSLDFTTKIIEDYPEITRFHPIAAGHGYTFPDTLKIPKEYLKTPIIPFKKAEEKHIPVWVTEISDIDPLDTSVEDGIQWAKTFHRYLSDANVNGFIWWCGAMPTTTNESLIVLNPDQENFILTKRYDMFGNFTRYIPEGSKRIEVENRHSELLISAFKKGKEYSIVIINPTKESQTTTISLNNEKVLNSLRGYLTDETNRWKESSYQLNKKKELELQISKESVITLVGHLK